MTEEQDKKLEEKMSRIGYPDFDILPGQDDILMVFVNHSLVCGAEYALTISDDELKSLVVGVVAAHAIQSNN